MNKAMHSTAKKRDKQTVLPRGLVFYFRNDQKYAGEKKIMK